MGFPPWTLWGMGLSGLGALIALSLAFLALSPRLMVRMRLFGWENRLRTFVGYAFAFLLLSVGFFLAGVPLGGQSIAAEATATVAGAAISSDVEGVVDTTVVPNTSSTLSTATATLLSPSTRTSGAFGGPLVTATPMAVTEESQELLLEATRTPRPPSTPVDTSETLTPTPTATATSTSTPTPSPTPTLTPSPTMTPTPTITPTPIEGDTALIDTQGSTLWVRRTPSGQTLDLVSDGDTVILLPGHANQAGILWQEVSTVSGVIGWVQLEFLDFGQE